MPFIATASIASRPSMTVCIGVPEVNPSTDVHSSCSAPARMPGLPQQAGQARAEPLRVADVRPADRVGHAGQRDVVVDQRAAEQLVEADA